MRIDTHYELVTQVAKPLLPSESGDYLSSIEGELRCHVTEVEDDEDYEDEKRIDMEALEQDPVVGYVKAYLIQARRAIEEGADLLEECEAQDSDISQLAEAFYQPEASEFRTNIMSQFAPNRLDLLSIEMLMIDPKHRGQALGLWMIQRVVETYGGGCGLLALNVTPSQAYLDENDEPSVFEQHPEKDVKVATTKLIEYFSPLGLEQVKGTSYLAKSLKDGFLPVIDEEDLEDFEEIELKSTALV